MLWRMVMCRPDQGVFHYKPHDSLTLKDTQCISSTVQAGEERREGLRQAHEGGPIVGLVSDCLQLSTDRLFTLARRGLRSRNCSIDIRASW